MRTDDGWMIAPEDIEVGLAGEPTDAWLMQQDGSTRVETLPDVTRYITPGVWPRYLCRCDQVRRMVESVDSNYRDAAHLFNHRLAAEGWIPQSAIEVIPAAEETPRMMAARFARTLVSRLQRSSTPTFTLAGVLEAATADPTAMVLTAEDGTLTVDTTDDDIADYQHPGQWPRYVCRAATLQSMVDRLGAETAATRLAELFAATLAFDTREGPYMPRNPDPNVADASMTETGA
jgi:hypothetical protein